MGHAIHLGVAIPVLNFWGSNKLKHLIIMYYESGSIPLSGAPLAMSYNVDSRHQHSLSDSHHKVVDLKRISPSLLWLLGSCMRISQIPVITWESCTLVFVTRPRSTRHPGYSLVSRIGNGQCATSLSCREQRAASLPSRMKIPEGRISRMRST